MTIHRARGTALMLLLLATGARAQSEEPGPAVEDVRETVGKWIATQKLIYQERRDWQQQREILGSRVELMRKEIGELEAKLAETGRTAAEADEKKSAAGAERRRLQEESDHLAAAVGEFEVAVRRIETLLPPPVLEKVQPLLQRVPEDPHSTKVSVAERFQNVLGFLNEVNKANADIILATEVRTLSGKPTEVKTVYLGLAQAYYLSAKGEAGAGRPTPDGWVWTVANDLAPRILEVVEILEGKAQPKFISLPVKIS